MTVQPISFALMLVFFLCGYFLGKAVAYDKCAKMIRKEGEKPQC